MGLRAGFTEITPETFAQIVRGEEPDVGGGARHQIDKAWDDFHTVFGRLEPPLSLIIVGDCLHPQSPQSLREFFDGYHEYYVGFMSPTLVRDIADALLRLPLSQLKQWYDELGVGQYDLNFYLFDELKAAYVEAAKRGNALMIAIA